MQDEKMLGKEHDISEHPLPVVFHFRPTKFWEVPPEKLREWEEMFVKYVGSNPNPKAACPWTGDPKQTISGSGDQLRDDSDYW